LNVAGEVHGVNVTESSAHSNDAPVPENVKLTLENQVLTMSGEKANGTFRRSFTVANTIDVDRIEATIEHGVLTVLLPKAERAKPREIPVKVA
jgi:HSP20 family protein